MIPVVPRAAKIWYLELAVDEYMEKEREKNRVNKRKKLCCIAYDEIYKEI